MSKSVSNFITVGLICIISIFAYHFRSELAGVAMNIKELIVPTKPCEKPLTYSLGQFDSEFNITQAVFLKALEQAEKIWETPSKKDLFKYADNGSVQVNLIFDYRQQATQKLTEVGGVIKNKSAVYDAAKAEYDSLYARYIQEKANLENVLSAHKARSAAYEEQIAYWNSRGGAPKNEYQKLEDERMSLNEEARELNERQNEFNKGVEKLNMAARQLNTLAKDLNINVHTYNTIGASTGEEFNEGEYVSDIGGEKINIYQYEDMTMLIRVLAHELGHALGLDHVDQSGAIMYRLNEGSTLSATKADVSALTALCTEK